MVGVRVLRDRYDRWCGIVEHPRIHWRLGIRVDDDAQRLMSRGEGREIVVSTDREVWIVGLLCAGPDYGGVAGRAEEMNLFP